MLNFAVTLKADYFAKATSEKAGNGTARLTAETNFYLQLFYYANLGLFV